jgi:hypothetical protein
LKKGVDANKLKATGKGECCPIAEETVNGKDNLLVAKQTEELNLK